MIRVYSLPEGTKLHTFTRGFKMTTQYYLSFSRTDEYLLSTSETGTIHFFSLKEATKDKPENHGELKIAKPSGWFNFFISRQCDDYMNAIKSQFFINHPLLVNKYNICAISL
jgi:hypothetical protein